jgi:ABC-type multidrug transport system fused ATPase/permease subunit
MTSKPMPVSGPPGSLADSVRKCLHLIGRERRRRWLLLIVLALAVSGFEAAGALLVLLMLGLVTAPDERLVLPAVGDVRTWLPGLEQDELLLLAAVFIAAFFLVRAAVVLAQAYLQHRVANNAGARLSTRLLHGYLSMPYEFHLARSSSDLIRNSHQAVQELVDSIFLPVVRVAAHSVVVLRRRKSQVDLLKTLAVEWRGENGVERLENRLGKPLKDMTRAEADEWIDRLTPEGRE